VRILVAEAVAREGIDLLAADHDVDERLGCTTDELVALIPEYDALVVRSQVQVDAALIEAGTRLVVIGRAGVGVDNVDLEAATRAGITVVNAPTGNTIAAAEHTLALLYGVARQTGATLPRNSISSEFRRSRQHKGKTCSLSVLREITSNCCRRWTGTPIRGR
jgi:D-3-phosphoglycerate dehydrogenase